MCAVSVDRINDSINAKGDSVYSSIGFFTIADQEAVTLQAIFDEGYESMS